VVPSRFDGCIVARGSGVTTAERHHPARSAEPGRGGTGTGRDLVEKNP